MDTLAHLPASFDQFARAAQDVCARINPTWRAYVAAGWGYAGIAEPQRYFTITAFDHSTANVLRTCGTLVYQTDSMPTPEAALTALAEAHGLHWPPPAPQPAAVALPLAEPMGARQKEEIIRLLNHPKISRREKTLTLAGLHKFDSARAEVCIGKARQAIEERENAPLALAA